MKCWNNSMLRTLTFCAIVLLQQCNFVSPSNSHDLHYMLQALDAAIQSNGHTRPNPIVGCVIIDKNQQKVGTGWHQKSGESHAEVFALNEARENANGGTAYVSLEPCNHFGRTPPCTLSILRHGVKRVVAGMVDPDPRVSGDGVLFLKKHGIEVEVGVGGNQCKMANAPYVFRVTHGYPYIVGWSGLMPIIGNCKGYEASSKTLMALRQTMTTVCSEVDTLFLSVGDFMHNTSEDIQSLLRRLDQIIPNHIDIIISQYRMHEISHVTTHESKIRFKWLGRLLSGAMMKKCIQELDQDRDNRETTMSKVQSALDSIESNRKWTMLSHQHVPSTRLNQLNETTSNSSIRCISLSAMIDTLNTSLTATSTQQFLKQLFQISGSNCLLIPIDDANTLKSTLQVVGIQRIVATTNMTHSENDTSNELYPLADPLSNFPMEVGFSDIPTVSVDHTDSVPNRTEKEDFLRSFAYYNEIERKEYSEQQPCIRRYNETLHRIVNHSSVHHHEMLDALIFRQLKLLHEQGETSNSFNLLLRRYVDDEQLFATYSAILWIQPPLFP